MSDLQWWTAFLWGVVWGQMTITVSALLGQYLARKLRKRLWGSAQVSPSASAARRVQARLITRVLCSTNRIKILRGLHYRIPREKGEQPMK